MGLFNRYYIKIVQSDNEELLKLLQKNNLKTEQIMATLQELSAQVDDLQAALDAEQTQIADSIANLEETITRLQGLVNDAGTPEERQALADKLVSIKADLEGTIPDESSTDEDTNV